MSEITTPVLTDETGQSIVTKLQNIADAIDGTTGEKFPQRIVVSTPPTKVMYKPGDTVDLTGIQVSVVVSAIGGDPLYDITGQCVYSPANGATIQGTETAINISWTWGKTGDVFTTSQPITIVPVDIVSWASGTDEQIAAMLEAHYNGDIDITDYWNVGDERVVSLSAMAATGVSEAHSAQDVTLVLANEGGKILSSDQTTECAYVVALKKPLDPGTFDVSTGYSECGYMGASDSNAGWWKDCARRTWCNEVFKGAFPETLRGIFKQFINVSSKFDFPGHGTDTTDDYFALMAEKEFMGSNSKAYADSESSLSQFEYFNNSSVRNNYTDLTDGSYSMWTRSAWNYDGWSQSQGVYYTYVDNQDGSSSQSRANYKKQIAPFGVI